MPDSEEIVIVLLTEDCYDAVYALWQACEGLGLNEADSRERIAQYLRRNPGTSFIAQAGGTIIGTVLGGHDGRRGYLHHLAVHPAYRKRGIGRGLVHAALEAIRAQGIDRCHGFVFRSNVDGLSFWEAAGWTARNDICLISKPLTDPEGRC